MPSGEIQSEATSCKFSILWSIPLGVIRVVIVCTFQCQVLYWAGSELMHVSLVKDAAHTRLKSPKPTTTTLRMSDVAVSTSSFVSLDGAWPEARKLFFCAFSTCTLNLKA